MPLPSLIGTDANWLGRLKSVLPQGWIANSTPLLDMVLTGVADMYAWCWAMLLYVQTQARIGTATGNFLDAASADFNGGGLPRLVNENDAAYRARIQGNMFVARNTRAAISAALTTLTGNVPVIFEPNQSGDTGAWDTGSAAWDRAGFWGDVNLPSQFFITVSRKLGGGVPNVSGWDAGGGGWDAGAVAWTDTSGIIGQVSDAAIYAAINAAKPAATVAWVQII